MHARFQDAMAIVRKLDKPDFFITITCNPQWPEIQRALQRGTFCLTVHMPRLPVLCMLFALACI